MEQEKHTLDISSIAVSPRMIFTFAILSYFLTRSLFIAHYPIFNDEALTMRYGKIMIEVPGQRLYTLVVGGKQPLLFWLDGLLAQVIPDPLLAGRVVSLAAGFFTLVAIYVITKSLFDRYSASLAGLLYALSPINVFFDGLAIHDSALTLLYSLVIFGVVLLARRMSWPAVLLIATSIAISLWIKTTGLLFLFIAITSLLYLYIKKTLSLGIATLAIASIILIVQLALVPLFMRPEIIHLFRMQEQYALSAGDILRFPLDRWMRNFRDAILIYVGYLSPFVFGGAIASCIAYRKRTLVILLMVVFISSLGFLVVTGITLHARYVLFSGVPLFVLGAGYLKTSRYVIIATVVSMAAASTILSVNPPLFFHLFPQFGVYVGESGQYVDGWPSGYGVMEALRFVDQHRAGRDAFVGVRWDAGNPEDTILMYAPKISGITSSFFDKRLDNFQALVAEHRGKPMYLITRTGQRGDLDSQLTLLSRFPKPSEKEFVEVYQFHPNP